MFMTTFDRSVGKPFAAFKVKYRFVSKKFFTTVAEPLVAGVDIIKFTILPLTMARQLAGIE